MAKAGKRYKTDISIRTAKLFLSKVFKEKHLIGRIALDSNTGRVKLCDCSVEKHERLPKLMLPLPQSLGTSRRRNYENTSAEKGCIRPKQPFSTALMFWTLYTSDVTTTPARRLKKGTP